MNAFVKSGQLKILKVGSNKADDQNTQLLGNQTAFLRPSLDSRLCFLLCSILSMALSFLFSLIVDSEDFPSTDRGLLPLVRERGVVDCVTGALEISAKSIM